MKSVEEFTMIKTGKNTDPITALRKSKRTEKRFNACLPWSRAEVAKLTKLYPMTSDKDLAVILARPVWGVTGKARTLRLEKDYAGGYRRQQCFSPVPWSDNEEKSLQALFPTTPNEEIAETLGRSLNAVLMKSRKLGLRKMEFWSKDEDELLKKLYKNLSYKQLAQRLERTKSAVQIRVITLGLECKVENWTEDEMNFLKKSYRRMTYYKIGEKLGRTWTAVARKAKNMGLVKKNS